MWKNTDGVYTADPRRVPDAFSISSLKYDEAMELAYFGAQVLHPSAMVPCIDDSIPVYVRNIFNPDFEGTVIQGRCPTLQDDINNKGGKVKNWRSNKGVSPIKGITSVDKVSLVSLEGASAIGGANVAEKFMGAMADNGINVLIITQASSESSITVAVPANQGEKALASLQDAFELELTRSTIGKLFLTTDMSIVAIVGEGMAMSSGVSATFMSSLARANVNIRVIAQGSSERQIAVVVDSSDTTRALRAAHMAFTLSETAVSVAVLGGTGDVGSSFVRQLQGQKAMLAKNLDVEMRVNIAANSQKMLFGKDFRGLDLDCLSEKLSKNSDAADLDLDLLTAELEKDVNPHRVIVDCTNSMAVGEYYEKWLSSGISIISPNRKVAAGPLDYYRRVRRAQRENSVSWQYEAGVGSALPLLTTWKDLIDTGDKINYIKGSVSGTLAYVLSTMSEDIPFSEAVRQAVEKGYAEIDFREDLAGEDMSRKVVILARQIGMDVEMSDVQVESLIPDEIIKKEYPEDRKAMQQELLDDLKVMDESMLERFRAAEQNDSVLRYKFVIDAETGKCKCSLEPVPRTDPLYRLKANENLVAFETDLYTTSPLIVKGAAAGPELAAAGIFSDLLRVTRTFSSLQI
jgi:aspartokinase/homoserine dehydrogenase 1